jgi:hypothetical protein
MLDDVTPSQGLQKRRKKKTSRDCGINPKAKLRVRRALRNRIPSFVVFFNHEMKKIFGSIGNRPTAPSAPPPVFPVSQVTTRRKSC